MPQHIPITVNGNTYNTIRAAWRDLAMPLGLSEIAVRKRLRSGWNVADALLTPPIPPNLRRAGH